MYTVAVLVVLCAGTWALSTTRQPVHMGTTTQHHFHHIGVNKCQTNADCPSIACCVHDYKGQYCQPYQNETHTCHLAGHQALVYKCGCAPATSTNSRVKVVKLQLYGVWTVSRFIHCFRRCTTTHCSVTGLVCDQLHLDPNHHLNNIQAQILQAEQLLAHQGLGICAQAHSP